MWRAYPDARCSLDYRNPFELLVATILSAQCTDVRVNAVTPELFRRFPTPEAMAAADPAELEEVIRSTGFYRNKARNLLGASRLLVEEFGSRLPDTIEGLLRLPGVARKTANVVAGNSYGVVEGVVVDTHVGRLSRRLGFTQEKDPIKVERDLMALVEQRHWLDLSHLLIYHGRAICLAHKPRCPNCPLQDLCPSAVTGGE